MPMPIKSVLLVSKEHHAPASETAREMSAWLKTRGVSGQIVHSHMNSAVLHEAGKNKDLALILGGDGTMLGAYRGLAGLDIPLLGVNFGRVGFLAEIAAENWASQLQALLDGEFTVRKHMVLAWRAELNGKITGSGLAVNDVVVARGELARAIAVDLSVDGFMLSRLRCDGVIVAAPLGSTAYSASAGGPLTYPELNAQIVTAISPFAGAFPPLVLPAAAEISLSSKDHPDARLTIDGQENRALSEGENVIVQGAPENISLLARDPQSYYRRLVRHGFIQTGPGDYR